LPQSAEHLLVLREVLDARRLADGPFQRAADERRDGRGRAREREVACGLFTDEAIEHGAGDGEARGDLRTGCHSPG
jgi:hypothetical protein